MICMWCQQKFIPSIQPWQLFVKRSQLDQLCRNCQRKFLKLGKQRCPQCGRAQTDSKKCLDCQSWERLYQGKTLVNHAQWHYNAGFHDLMVAYKRYGDYELRPVLRSLAKSVQDLAADYYVPVPTSPEHLAKRQFDTVEAIFATLVPLTHVLAKASGTSPQGEKNRQERLQAKQSFFVKSKMALSGKILILDDIYTTGRTLYHARDALLAAYPDCQISSFTIAR